MKQYFFFLYFAFFCMTCYGQAWTKDYDRVDECKCGLALVMKNGKFGFTTETGKIVVPLIYDDALSFSEGKAAVMKDLKWGFIDSLGHEFVKPQYAEVFSFSEGLAVVGNGVDYGFIDPAGNMAIPMIYANARGFVDGIAPASNKQGLWGYIDKNGKAVIDFKFGFATPFNQGTGKVLKSGSWYSIDKNGTVAKLN